MAKTPRRKLANTDMKRRAKFNLHPVHRDMDLFDSPITQHVWAEKYRHHKSKEQHPWDSMKRVCKGVYANDSNDHLQDALEAMKKGLWVPGGRIHAGAGTDKVVTLINCFVMSNIEDSMPDIMRVLGESGLTMQQGGGIGMNFGTLRPSGAYLTRTQAVASGPLPFMDMWDAMCATIMSAGSRRGAMMGVITDDHPDLPSFILAKQKQGRMTNFNISVLITDAFMDAVATDEDWDLGFEVPRADGKHLAVVEREGEKPWYVYTRWKARELWDMIIRNTYEYSEPGVIFIDRINDQNNLKYCETISATNPCGEQPLPPYGACNLGAVNLSRMVRDPFGEHPTFDFGLLDKIVRLGVRFLDNVIEVSGYPLPQQRQEEIDKRRIGLGITGLGNALAMMKLRYGTEASLSFTDTVMRKIKESAYDASIDLAEERGPFRLYTSEWGQDTSVVASLPSKARLRIGKHGIRNGVILTIAPTGTTSLYMGNCSSGLEPVFLFETSRKVRQPDGGYETFTVMDYGWKVFSKVYGDVGSNSLPDYLVTHEALTPEDHIRIQGVCQRHIDASVSKTVNCPENMDFESFKLLYWDAYNAGCKGCTTYRPSEVRGSVLGEVKKKEVRPEMHARPEALAGVTYKIRWPNTEASYYITINSLDGCPREIFISTTDSQYSEWMTALCLMISAIMRLGYDISFVPEELKKVSSHRDQAWVDGTHYSSLVSLIADILGNHLKSVVDSNSKEEPSISLVNPQASQSSSSPAMAPAISPSNNGPQRLSTYQASLGHCPKCSQMSLLSQEGCKSCQNPDCNYSTCT